MTEIIFMAFIGICYGILVISALDGDLFRLLDKIKPFLCVHSMLKIVCAKRKNAEKKKGENGSDK